MANFKKIDCGTNKWYFTSDQHLGHHKIITYCNRPFETIQQHDNTILDNINSIVQENDNLVIGGDFSFGDPYSFIKRINCKNLYFVIGSHDKLMWKYNRMFKEFTEKLCLDVNGQSMVITHCPHLCWEKSHYGTWHLFGHIHSGKSPKADNMTLFDQVIAKGKMLDVGVDGHNFKPWSFEEIKEVLDKKDGFLVKRK